MPVPTLRIRFFLPGLALFGGLPATSSVPHVSEPTPVERETFVMGTRLRGTVLVSTPAAGFAALEAIFAEVRRVERVLSSWRQDSELSRLNRSRPGVRVQVSAELLDLIVTVRTWSERTGGAFDPAVGALIDTWDLRGSGRCPSPTELARARSSSGSWIFELDERRRTVTRRDPEAWMSAGAFGKGAALRDADRVLAAAGVESALLDFGGQMVAIGSPARGSGWVVGVAHPAQRQREVARLRLRDRSVATSSASERFVEVDGVAYGHVLDPRTGRPVRAWGSVTVVVKDPLVADVLSTALFVMGPDAGMEWARGLDGVGVLYLIEESAGLKARWNTEMDRWLVELGTGVSRSDGTAGSQLQGSFNNDEQAVRGKTLERCK